jgi:hypothetical protein
LAQNGQPGDQPSDDLPSTMVRHPPGSHAPQWGRPHHALATSAMGHKPSPGSRG